MAANSNTKKNNQTGSKKNAPNAPEAPVPVPTAEASDPAQSAETDVSRHSQAPESISSEQTDSVKEQQDGLIADITDTENVEESTDKVVDIIGPTKEEIIDAVTEALNASVENTKSLKGKVVSPRGDTSGKVLLFDTRSRKIITGFISRSDAEKQKRNNPNIEIINDEKEAGKF